MYICAGVHVFIQCVTGVGRGSGGPQTDKHLSLSTFSGKFLRKSDIQGLVSLKIFGPWRGGGCVVVANLYMGMSSMYLYIYYMLTIFFSPVVVDSVLFLQDFFQKNKQNFVKCVLYIYLLECENIVENFIFGFNTSGVKKIFRQHFCETLVFAKYIPDSTVWKMWNKEMSSIWLTNSALVYEHKCGGGGGCRYQPMSKAVHMEPK
jgi:hypothetical protein